jgi:alanyl-tRNA synthetase
MHELIIEQIVNEKNKIKAFLLENPFYPDGKGGQTGDRGKIEDADVIYVFNDYILLNKEISAGKHTFIIDEENRFDIAQQHTGQHLISAAFHKLFNIKTVSFRMAEEYSTIDLDSEDISDIMIDKIENLCFKKINENLPIEKILVSLEEANKFNLRKVLSDKIDSEVRIIKIGDFDLTACGGFHLESTLQVNLIKILKKEKVKGNLTRIYFISGERCLKDYREKNEILKNISSKLTTGIEFLENKIDSLTYDLKEKKLELKNVSENYSVLLLKKLKENNIQIKDKKILFYEESNNAAANISKIIDIDNYIYVYGKEDTYSINSDIFDCGNFVKILKNDFDIKGGGNKNNANIKGKIKLTQIIDIIKTSL